MVLPHLRQAQAKVLDAAYGPWLLGFVAADYLFIPPRGQLGPQSSGEVIGLLAYLFTCGVTVLLGESARRATRKMSFGGVAATS